MDMTCRLLRWGARRASRPATTGTSGNPDSALEVLQLAQRGQRRQRGRDQLRLLALVPDRNHEAARPAVGLAQRFLECLGLVEQAADAGAAVRLALGIGTRQARRRLSSVLAVVHR